MNGYPMIAKYHVQKTIHLRQPNTPPFVTEKTLRMVKFAEDYAQPLSNCAPIINDWRIQLRDKKEINTLADVLWMYSSC